MVQRTFGLGAPAQVEAPLTSPAPVTTVDVGVVAGDGGVHIVRLTWLRGSLTDEVVAEIVGSIRVS